LLCVDFRLPGPVLKLPIDVSDDCPCYGSLINVWSSSDFHLVDVLKVCSTSKLVMMIDNLVSNDVLKDANWWGKKALWKAEECSGVNQFQWHSCCWVGCCCCCGGQTCVPRGSGVGKVLKGDLCDNSLGSVIMHTYLSVHILSACE
jgi:hypothetical protein